jgi:hypothetical protein
LLLDLVLYLRFPHPLLFRTWCRAVPENCHLSLCSIAYKAAGKSPIPTLVTYVCITPSVCYPSL